MPFAIARLPAARRRAYADRVSVLLPSTTGSLFVHEAFNCLRLPTLKEVILDNKEEDRNYEFWTSGMTGTSLMAIEAAHLQRLVEYATAANAFHIQVLRSSESGPKPMRFSGL